MLLHIKAYLPALLWSIFIFVLCLIPGKDIPHVPIMGIDKIIHFTLFGVLIFLYLKSTRKGNKNLTQPHIILFLFLIMAYGILLEIFQGNFVPGRTADLYDTIANSLGVICVYLGHFFIKN